MKHREQTNKQTPETPQQPAANQTAPAPAPDQAAAATAQPLTQEQIESLKQQAAKAQEYWERLLRTAADFENFKKRAARERHDAVKYANQSLIQKLLPVLDNLELAEAAARNHQSGSGNSVQAGVVLTAQLLKRTLSEAGLEEIDACGKPFDPRWHEAVGEQESASVPEGQVLQQLRKGYKLHDRLLRPASVVVAKKPSTAAAAASGVSAEPAAAAEPPQPETPKT